MKLKVRLEIIYWDDASDGRGPEAPEDILTYFPLLTTGQYVKEDKRSVTVALDSFRGRAETRVRHYVVIPKVNIISRRSLSCRVALESASRKPVGAL